MTVNWFKYCELYKTHFFLLCIWRSVAGLSFVFLLRGIHQWFINSTWWCQLESCHVVLNCPTVLCHHQLQYQLNDPIREVRLHYRLLLYAHMVSTSRVVYEFAHRVIKVAVWATTYTCLNSIWVSSYDSPYRSHKEPILALSASSGPMYDICGLYQTVHGFYQQGPQ